jgi:hypothetical protein
MLRFLDHMTDEGFLRREYREMLIVDSDVDLVLDRYSSHHPPQDKWSTRHSE